MPAKLSVTVTRTAPIELKRRMLNQIMRNALEKAAEYWIATFMKMHFEQGAYQRYSYQSRTQLYNKIKNRMRRVRPWIGRSRGPWMAAPKPVRPLQWSGVTMNDLLRRPLSGFNVRPTATTSRQQVVVPLKIQHPIPKEHAWEFGALIESEFKMMHIVALESIEHDLEAIRGEIVTKLAA